MGSSTKPGALGSRVRSRIMAALTSSSAASQRHRAARSGSLSSFFGRRRRAEAATAPIGCWLARLSLAVVPPVAGISRVRLRFSATIRSIIGGVMTSLGLTGRPLSLASISARKASWLCLERPSDPKFPVCRTMIVRAIDPLGVQLRLRRRQTEPAEPRARGEDRPSRMKTGPVANREEESTASAHETVNMPRNISK
jgi:hypothetical protein